jgi:hypothetical protein
MKSVLLAFLGGIATAQTFQVAGVIVDGESNAPMKRVRIALAPSDKRTQQVAMITGEDGTFSFDARAGKYALTAERGGLRQPFGLISAGVGFGSLIISGPDQHTAHLVFRWFPPGAISGTIFDDRGEPAENALVQLIRVSVVGGRRHSGTFAWTRADDRGHYRFGALTAGTYYLAVTAEPWYASRLNRTALALHQLNQAAKERGITSDAEPAPPTTPPPAYAATYYPDTTDARGAAPLILRPAAEVRADFTLLTITGVNIHVNCSNATGRNGMLSLLADGIEGVEGFQRQLNFNGSSYVIAGVPPGRYIVRVAGSGENPFAVRKTIDVGASDVTVDLNVQPAPTVSGKVVFKTKPNAAIYLRLVNEATNAALSRAIEPDGTFSFANVAVAKFRPLIGSTEGFFASRVVAEGATLTDGVLDVVDGATVKLNVVASDEIGRVKGFVMNGEKPVPGALVVLAQSSGLDPFQHRGFQTDTDGSFDFQNVHAGDWLLFAVDRLDLEYKNPEAVRPYFSSAKPVRVDPHGLHTENISLSPLVSPN